MIGNKILNNKNGFTLAEMLVTVGVFSIAVMISSAVFMNVNKLQQNTANMQILQTEGRYVMEKIAKEIRGRELDYSQLELTDGLTENLIFKKDEFGEIFLIGYDSNAKAITVANGENEVNLSSEDIIVETIKFIVMPASVTDALLVTSTLQSRVTIMMQIKNSNSSANYQKSLNLQTTISSKAYH